MSGDGIRQQTRTQPPRSSFPASLRVALEGAARVVRGERNARIEAAIGLLAILLGLWLQIRPLEWAVVVTLIALVLGLEMVNTAIEATVDLLSPDVHPLAKKAKDSAAGAVVTAALGSVIVGLFIFGPRLWALLVG